MLAQGHPSPSELVQQLQSEKTTNNARGELLRLGKSDPGVRQYLAAHLPPLIESGPSKADCQENSCETWLNAVELAGRLKIAKAVPALAQWISWRERPAPFWTLVGANVGLLPSGHGAMEDWKSCRSGRATYSGL